MLFIVEWQKSVFPGSAVYFGRLTVRADNEANAVAYASRKVARDMLLGTTTVEIVAVATHTEIRACPR